MTLTTSTSHLGEFDDNRRSKDGDLSPQLTRFLGRDVSLLEFHRRVLAQAQNADNPLLERVNFIAILGSNIDEFFMKRVALLRQFAEAGIEALSHDGLSIQQQLSILRECVEDIEHQQGECLLNELIPELAQAGVLIVPYLKLSDLEKARVGEWYRANVFPILTPLAVDPGHRFPFISNLSVSLGVMLCQQGHSQRQFARIKIPEGIPRLVSLPESGAVGELHDVRNLRLIPVDEIIRHNLSEVFPGMEIVDVLPFRVTRSAGLELEEEEGAENLLKHVEDEVRQRRFANPVRIETRPSPSRAILSLLLEELELDESDVYVKKGPLDNSDLRELVALDRPDLKMPTWVPIVPPRLYESDADIFSIIRERDVFIHHPYESFQASVERFIAAAARDPQVVAIKQTLYRTSRESPFLDSLILAAEEGKAVACMVELRARFDEDRNVHVARELEKHGVHVAYGVVGLKTHCKCSLVVRKENDGLRCYAHFGTGNYHPGTAQLYTDCGLMTCNQAITNELISLFNYLTGRSMNVAYHNLIVAPTAMRRRMEELIDREIESAKIGKPARIVAKMNQLEDRRIIEKLYEASCAGVEIVLIVRGFCCLRPQIKGMSDNIRVLSIVGRFLEHSRIYYFSAGSSDPLEGEYFIGSADWMSRNLDDRVETLVLVRDELARQRLQEILHVNITDRTNAWELGFDAHYKRLQVSPDASENTVEQLGTFESLCNRAKAMSRPDSDSIYRGL